MCDWFMNIYTWKLIILLWHKSCSQSWQSKILIKQIKFRTILPQVCCTCSYCALFRTATMQKKWACLAAVTKVCPERQPTTVVQVSLQSWKSGISWSTDAAWFQKSCPVVLLYGCVDSDPRACVSGKASKCLLLTCEKSEPCLIVIMRWSWIQLKYMLHANHCLDIQLVESLRMLQEVVVHKCL